MAKTFSLEIDYHHNGFKNRNSKRISLKPSLNQNVSPIDGYEYDILLFSREFYPGKEEFVRCGSFQSSIHWENIFDTVVHEQ